MLDMKIRNSCGSGLTMLLACIVDFDASLLLKAALAPQ
jgi:hypothetical protein